MDPTTLKPLVEVVGLPSALFVALILMLWKRRSGNVSLSEGAVMERLASVLRAVEGLSREVAGNHDEVRRYFQSAEQAAWQRHGSRHEDMKLIVSTTIQEWKEKHAA